MRVRVIFFAVLKEDLGEEALELHLCERSCLSDVISILRREFGSLGRVWEQSLIAVNGAYADPETELSWGDEIAVLPPVSGG